MEMKTILVILVLNIILPTLDTGTDISMVYKLYRGADYCFYDAWAHYKRCLEDPDRYFCKLSYQAPHDEDDYWKCEADPVREGWLKKWSNW